jgi:hypothetical protein
MTSRNARFAGSMAATLRVWGMAVLASAGPANAEPATQRSDAPAGEGAWIRDPHFTFLKLGYCARIYRCVAPEQVQSGARHFTVSPPKKEAGLCKPGVDSLDYCGLCETDEPKERCTYDLK